MAKNGAEPTASMGADIPLAVLSEKHQPLFYYFTCPMGIATQRPDLVKRLNPDIGSQRLINLVTAWDHELKEMMGGMGINSIEALRGNRLMLRGIGLNDRELNILGIKHAGE